jgi:hypothetical protein
MTPTLQILKRLNDAGVEYVVVGGVAAVLHGAELLTKDLDLCAPLNVDNLARIRAALDALHLRYRMLPDLPVVPEHLWQLPDLRNLYLLTDLGIIDILGEMSGVGAYQDALRQSDEYDFGEGVIGRLLNLDALIDAKRAAAREKDLRHIEILEAIRNQRRKQSPQ